jgi:vitamin B12 transporter
MNRNVLCATIVALLSLPVSGAVAASAEDVPLDDVVVTATRTSVTVDDTLASVNVITRDDIERLQAQSVAELLRGLPGVSISANGGAGKQTSLFLRGTESDHVLFLVDGIKIGSATSGGAALQDIPVDQIERIELVRGPRSSLYGSEAIGGVIQIFTRRGRQPFAPEFSVGYGTDNTRKVTAGVALNGDRGWLSANGAYNDTDGFNACYGKPSPGGAGCFTYEPDDDPYRNVSASLRGGFKFSDAVEADASFLRAEGHNYYDGSFVNESKYVQQVAGGSLKIRASDSVNLNLTLGRADDKSDSYANGVYMSRFNTQRDNASLQGDFALAQGQLVSVGVDHQNDDVDSDTAYVEDSRVVNGVFAQYQGRFGANHVDLSARRDDNSQYGNHTTGGAAWGYDFTPDLRFTASYGTAFKAPTFNELYYPGYGNANLQPEDSRSVEVGLDGRAGGVRWGVHAYETRVDDLIAFDASTFAPGNVDKARLRGLEGTFGFDVAEWKVDGSVTALDPKNDSPAFDGKILPRRARATARVDVDRRFGDFAFGATGYAAGKRWDDLSNTRRLGGYATLDLRAEYAFAPSWIVQAKVENVADRDYETAAWYAQPGRTYFVTLRYRGG